ncbi:type II toxin-antitoxin system RatA family toxin [Thiothrix subterranea]|uniref:Type II toxin-antitoxin system RatA family toxin n=1 Tax=Thiothrix subterranea TaxID=2735563 RepID=A0AA51MQ88_9GAMM|nr:type II toxin-antitoxin system RatA family toxin [Thiothrix subterranea]MDQ5768842.1 type II toxin-antitoxin system RatA family toxin [Thiothrix subterranea]QQZ28014.1 type II toxin-antitoxin system RatA family toxin [Thiothrix subterranea]WML86477.1 type II toxin-antitoxin system RatA family toxin [Thiothrix subterranea]
MAHISRSALVPYSPAQMYQLVDGINLYPQFLPWCRTAVEHQRDTDQVKASIEIAKGAVNKRFTTLNRLQQNKTIEMRLIDGPFQHLHGFWRFDELKAGACKVSLDLDFEFSNKILSLVVGPVFNQVANTLVDSFVERAKKVYGKP